MHRYAIILWQNAGAHNSISFMYPAGYTGGTLSVTATNGCGSSSSKRLSVARLNPATPGVIDVIQLQSCPNKKYSYTLAAMPFNAISVQWMAPATAIVFTRQETASIIVDYPPTAVFGSLTATATSGSKKATINKDGMLITNITANGLAAGLYQLHYIIGHKVGY